MAVEALLAEGVALLSPSVGDSHLREQPFPGHSAAVVNRDDTRGIIRGQHSRRSQVLPC